MHKTMNVKIKLYKKYDLNLVEIFSLPTITPLKVQIPLHLLLALTLFQAILLKNLLLYK